MAILVTGAAGFIGSHVCNELLARGDEVVGIDDLNDYYDPALKHARLASLEPQRQFTFIKGSIADAAALDECARGRKVTHIVHLAAQAGVRYSLINPQAYIESNIRGHLEVLELARRLGTVEHLVYASSSSVYGGNQKVPFSEADPVDHPVSLYAATKKSDELISHSYAHLFGIPQTGLRYFTVYGPMGRPDMAYWIFTKAIFERQPIRVFNNGEMWRDFTFVDDIVWGTIAALNHPPANEGVRHRIYNIGNNAPEHLGRFIEILERLIGLPAEQIMSPMQQGDVVRTYADISAIQRELGFVPKVSLDEGLARFVAWYRQHFNL
jgi:UDP-glucuronate 4-epimerase